MAFVDLEMAYDRGRMGRDKLLDHCIKSEAGVRVKDLLSDWSPI